MTRSPFRYFLFCLALAFLTLGLHAVSAESRPSGEGVLPEDSGEPLSAQLRRAFGQLTPANVPTGVLLEAGAVYGDQPILQQDGRNDARALALSRADFAAHTYVNNSHTTLDYLSKLTVTDNTGLTGSAYCPVTVACDPGNGPYWRQY